MPNDQSATDDAQVFQIGLTMAGAISAGAYTAGVLETLLEAMDLHNNRYERGQAGEPDPPGDPFPKHKVVLRVISGTSAGGMSAGLGIASLIDARSVDNDVRSARACSGGRDVCARHHIQTALRRAGGRPRDVDGGITGATGADQSGAVAHDA